MDYLERRLQRMISKGKGNGIVAQSIRLQMAERESGQQSAQQKYIIGMAQEVPKATK